MPDNSALAGFLITLASLLVLILASLWALGQLSIIEVSHANPINWAAFWILFIVFDLATM